MIIKSKICGVSDTKTLRYIINHKNPPQFIGFIVNYPKSKRYVDIKKLKDLMKIEKKSHTSGGLGKPDRRGRWRAAARGRVGAL